MSLQELRVEYETLRIGPAIWGIVCELTGNVARQYPPSVYSDGLHWYDDSVEDLAQQVVLDGLLSESQLEYLFDQATSIESWRRLLTLQIRRTLAHRRRKTVVDRLLARLHKLAQVPPFRVHTVGRAVWISHGESVAPFVDLDDSRTSHLANSVRYIPQMAGWERLSRASMVYTTPDLRLLLESVLREVGAVRERDLARILELLLTSWLPTFLQSLERDFPSDEPSPEAVAEDAEMRSTIRDFVVRLSESQRYILLSKSQSVPDGEIALRLERLRPWVAEQKRLVLERLDTELMTRFDADRHLQATEILLTLISDSLDDIAE